MTDLWNVERPRRKMGPRAAKVAYGCWKHFMVNQEHVVYVHINIPASQAK